MLSMTGSRFDLGLLPVAQAEDIQVMKVETLGSDRVTYHNLTNRKNNKYHRELWSRIFNPLTPTVAIWVQLQSILCQSGVSHH